MEFVRSSMDGLKEGNNLQLVILDKVTSEFLGCCGLHNLNESEPELGIWLKQSARLTHRFLRSKIIQSVDGNCFRAIS